MVQERVRRRLRERLHALADASLDPDEAQLEAIAALRQAVGFERWCWPRTDPRSALAMGGIADFDLWPELPRIAALEEHGDITSKPRLVIGPRASVALSTATGGDLARSRRWRECLAPYGVGDELMTVCCDRNGCWGSVELMRDSDEAPFDENDVGLLHQLAPTLGKLLRRSLPQGWPTERHEEKPLAPATLILDANLRLRSWTAAIADWQAELGGGGAPEMAPPAVYEIAARMLTPRDAATPLPASVRIRTPTGRWATIEGASLEGADRGHLAITIRASSSAEIFDLLSNTYDLTRRERQLVALILEGLATKELAQSLFISPNTVQDHLKSIFAKTGARSRGELTSRLTSRAHDVGPSPASA
jgi:DNA-binding CsgD family transcriptional regulator